MLRTREFTQKIRKFSTSNGLERKYRKWTKPGREGRWSQIGGCYTRDNDYNTLTGQDMKLSSEPTWDSAMISARRMAKTVKDSV